MLNSKTLDDLAHRIGEIFATSPAKDAEKNVKAMLQSGLQRPFIDQYIRRQIEMFEIIQLRSE